MMTIPCCDQCEQPLEILSDAFEMPNEIHYGCKECDLVFVQQPGSATMSRYHLTYRGYKAQQEGRLEEFLEEGDPLSQSPFL